MTLLSLGCVMGCHEVIRAYIFHITWKSLYLCGFRGFGVMSVMSVMYFVTGGQNDKIETVGVSVAIRLVGCTGLVCGKSEEGLSVSGKGK